MEAIKTYTKEYPRVTFWVGQIAIVLSVATIYWILCALNPAMAKSMDLVGLGKTVKIANMLRALVLVSPAGIVGTGIGAHAFNVSTGTVGILAYPILPAVIVGIGLFLHKISNKWGHTLLKDLIILATYGVLTGLVVSINKIGIAMLLHGTGWDKIMLELIGWKLWTSAGIVMLGYPLTKLWGKNGTYTK